MNGNQSKSSHQLQLANISKSAKKLQKSQTQQFAWNREINKSLKIAKSVQVYQHRRINKIHSKLLRKGVREHRGRAFSHFVYFWSNGFYWTQPRNRSFCQRGQLNRVWISIFDVLKSDPTTSRQLAHYFPQGAENKKAGGGKWCVRKPTGASKKKLCFSTTFWFFYFFIAYGCDSILIFDRTVYQ